MPQVQIYTRSTSFQPKAVIAACVITSALVALGILAWQWSRAKPIENATATPPCFHYLFGAEFHSLDQLLKHVKSDTYRPTEDETDVDKLIEQADLFVTDDNLNTFKEIIFSALDKGASFHNLHVYYARPHREEDSDQIDMLDTTYSRITMGSNLWHATDHGEDFCLRLIRHKSSKVDHTDIVDLVHSHKQKPIDLAKLQNIIKALFEKSLIRPYDELAPALVCAAQIDISLYRLLESHISALPDDYITTVMNELDQEQLDQFLDTYQTTYDLPFFSHLHLTNITVETARAVLAKTAEIGTRYPDFVNTAKYNGALLQAVFEQGSGSDRDFEALENWVKRQRQIPDQYYTMLAILVEKTKRLSSAQIDQIIPRLRANDGDLIQSIIQKSEEDPLKEAVGSRLLNDENPDLDLIRHFEALPLIKYCFEQKELDAPLILALLKCDISAAGFFYGKAFDQISVDDWDDMLAVIQKLKSCAYPSDDKRYDLDYSFLDTGGDFTRVIPEACDQQKTFSRFAVLRYIETLPMYDDLGKIANTTKKVIQGRPKNLPLGEIIEMTKYDEKILAHVLDAIDDKDLTQQVRDIQAAIKENTFPVLTASYKNLQWVLPRLRKPTMEELASIEDVDVVLEILDDFDDNELEGQAALVSYLKAKPAHVGHKLTVVEKLLEHGASVCTVDEDDIPPIIVALYFLSEDHKDDAAVINLLLSEGADLRSYAEQIQRDSASWDILAKRLDQPKAIMRVAYLKPYIDIDKLRDDDLSRCFRYEKLRIEQLKILVDIQELLPRESKLRGRQKRTTLVPSKSLYTLLRKQRVENKQ